MIAHTVTRPVELASGFSLPLFAILGAIVALLILIYFKD